MTRDSPPPEPPALAVRELRKIYANGQVALRGVDLTVRRGDFFALLGPNGAGKSTVIGIVSSLVNRSSGEVRIFGDDLASSPGAAKSHLGVVPQEFNFNVFETVHDIVLTQAGYHGMRRGPALAAARRYLGELGLWDRRDIRARELSGGMKRRLMIARALVHEPSLLILDEPTAGVDLEIRRSMWDFLRRLNHAGTTIILTTHYLEEAESLCKSIAIIDEGRIVEDTSMKALIDTLYMQTFVLDLSGPVAHPPEVPGYVLRRLDPTTLEADVRKEQGVNGLFAGLAAGGIEVVSLRTKSNRLEELFLRLIEGNGSRRRSGGEGQP